jgi:hypothetical protein
MIGWILRLAVIAGLLGSAWVHYHLWWSGHSDITIVSALFLVNAVTGVAITLLVLLLRHWLPALAAVGFGAVTLVAYMLSLTIGFFDMHEHLASQTEVWALICELDCVVFGAVLLFGPDSPTAPRHVWWRSSSASSRGRRDLERGHAQ